MTEWIDVKDRLPKLDETVIVATNSAVFSAMRRRFFDGKHLWTNAVWDYQPIEPFTGKILYWQPFPKLPELQLKPCPLCGFVAVYDEFLEDGVRIRCTNCGNKSDFYNNKIDAAKSWNIQKNSQ